MTPRFVRDARPAGRRAALCAVGLLWLAASGCGPVRAKPVDVELARETLIKVLQHWKSGGTIDDLRKSKPEIVAQEPLWSNGNKLVEFTLVGEGRKEDANWYCEVELNLESADGGKALKKKVTYVVGTDPVLTVFHAVL